MITTAAATAKPAAAARRTAGRRSVGVAAGAGQPPCVLCRAVIAGDGGIDRREGGLRYLAVGRNMVALPRTGRGRFGRTAGLDVDLALDHRKRRRAVIGDGDNEL